MVTMFAVPPLYLISIILSAPELKAAGSWPGSDESRRSEWQFLLVPLFLLVLTGFLLVLRVRSGGHQARARKLSRRRSPPGSNART